MQLQVTTAGLYFSNPTQSFTQVLHHVYGRFFSLQVKKEDPWPQFNIEETLKLYIWRGYQTKKT